MLMVEFLKRRKRITVVQSPDQAQLTISASVSTRDKKRGDGETVAAVLAYDRCGRVVWSKNKSRSGGAGRMRYTADAIATSLKEAVDKRKSRFSRAAPCQK